MELIATIRKERQNISALRIREQGKRLARIISSDFVLSDQTSPVSLVLTCCSMCFQRHMRLWSLRTLQLALENIIERGVTAGRRPLATS